jgi:hypothetical protein
MNRKLHNTVTALAATTGLLVLSLMAGAPVAPLDAASLAPATASTRAPTDAQIERIVGAAAEAATLAVIAAVFAESDASASIDTTSPAPAPARKHASRGRQSVAMPFFSFAPRG